jgi:hypothetical protein
MGIVARKTKQNDKNNYKHKYLKINIKISMKQRHFTNFRVMPSFWQQAVCLSPWWSMPVHIGFTVNKAVPSQAWTGL